MLRYFILLITLIATLVACTKSGSDSQNSASKEAHANFNPNDPVFKKNVQARLEEMKRDEAIQEQADWFGKTGLPDEDERELPRYLRREYGQLLSQPNALRAADLEYLGVFVQGAENVHFWRIHDGAPEANFAYIVVAPKERQMMGWGDRQPPK